LVEEVKEVSGLTLSNEEVFMATRFAEFSSRVVLRLRGGGQKKAVTYDTVNLHVNKMDVRYKIEIFKCVIRV
jgi:formyltetrahydrofolate dehydrogenase